MEAERKEAVNSAIEAGTPIKFRLYVMLDETEKELNYILLNILEKYSQGDFIHSLYTITKEMIINGTKANLKRLVFKKFNLSLENSLDYKEGLERLRERLKADYLEEHAQDLKEEGIYVDILFEHDQDGIKIEVLNNSALSKEEDKRIRNRFRHGQKYDNLAEFYMEQMDHQEGAGVGIAMVTILLKERGVHPHNFRIESDFNSYTKAMLIFPFDPEKASKRVGGSS